MAAGGSSSSSSCYITRVLFDSICVSYNSSEHCLQISHKTYFSMAMDIEQDAEKIIHIFEIVPISVEKITLSMYVDNLLKLRFFNMPSCVKKIVVCRAPYLIAYDKDESVCELITDYFRKNGVNEACEIIFD